eukprot:1753703-Pleurochrysis_carterae.AAC.2
MRAALRETTTPSSRNRWSRHPSSPSAPPPGAAGPVIVISDSLFAVLVASSTASPCRAGAKSGRSERPSRGAPAFWAGKLARAASSTVGTMSREETRVEA